MFSFIRSFILFIAIFSFNQHFFSQALTTSLTACYALDGNATDLISNLTGTVNSVSATADRNSNANSALYFSGSTGSYVELPDNPLIKPNALSFSAWIKPVTLSNAYILFTKNTSSVNIDAYSLSTVSLSTGYKFVITRTNGATTHTAACTTTLANNTWYHVAFTMDNIYLKIYINGVYQGFASSTIGFAYQSGKKVIFGGTNELINAPFNGAIDNAKFHNRTLTSSEITALYNNDFTCVPTPPPSCSNLFYTINTTTQLVYVSDPSQSPSATLTTLQLPVGAQCLAVGPSFSFTAPNPTFWTVANGTYWYYTGTGFCNTTHSCGTTVTSYAGGSKNFLYNFDPSNSVVNKYNGTGNATALPVLSSLPANYVSLDVAGDDLDNFYLLKTSTPQSLNVYNSMGNLACSYSVTGIPNYSSGWSFAILQNTVVVHDIYYHTGLITGSTINFTQTPSQNFPAPANFASCPVIVTSFSSAISASPNPTVSCYTPTVTLTANANVSSASYTWSGPGISGSPYNSSAQVTSAGVYSCYLKSCLGGTSSATYTVLNDPFQLVPTAVVSNSIDCFNAFAQISVSPNSGTNTILWSGSGIFGPANTPTITVTSGGVYTVSVSNTVNACAGTATALVLGNTAPLSLNVAASSTLICQPAPSITLSVSGANTYSWSPVASINSLVVINPSVSTTYSVVGNIGSCTGSAVVTISANITPTLINALGNATVCSGNTATLSLSGATNYTWSPGNLSGGTVVVTPTSNIVYNVTGANGFCSTTTTLSVNTLTVPVITTSVSSPIICEGNSSVLSASGAISYTWQPSSANGFSVSVTPSVNTTYSVIGSNIVGCSSNQTISLIVNHNPTVNVSSSSAAICEGKSGTLTAFGASSFTWYPSGIVSNTLVITPTVATIYSITGTSNNCYNTNTIAISVNSNPTITAISSSPSVCSGNSISLSAIGANTYTWIPGSIVGSSINVSPVATTNYTVTGEGLNGCSNTGFVSILVNSNPTLVASSSSPSICSGNSATLSVVGAASYTWSPGSTVGSSISVNPLTTTIYSVTGTNSLSCINTKTINIGVVPTPTLSPISSPGTICSGNTTTLTVSGASNYTWLPITINSASAVVSPTITSSYTVTGANGVCVSTASTVLNVNPNPTILTSSNPGSICSGSSNTLFALGANSYTWNPGGAIGASVAVSPLTSTIYTVTGMYSSTGCTTNVTALVSVTTTPSLSLAIQSNTICANSSATIQASGASLYTWIPGNLSGSNVTVSPSTSTIYTVTGVNGICSDSKTIALTVNPSPTLSASSNTGAVCGGLSANLFASGALNYTWAPVGLNGSSITVTPSTTTTYTVFGNNNFGCISSATVLLGRVNTPTLYAVASPTGVCIGGTINLSATGSSNYFWNPGIGSGANVIVTPTASMVYTLTSNSGPCSGSQTVAVTVYTSALVLANASPTSVCLGGSLTLNAMGASNYTWNPGSLNGGSLIIAPVTSGTHIYSVTGNNTGGCANTATVQVSVFPVPNPTISNSPGIICSGNSNTLSCSGVPNFTWYPSGSTSPNLVVSPTSNTTYTFLGTSFLGCPATVTVNVTVIPMPTIGITSSSSVVCAGSTVNLAASGANNYYWTPGALSGSAISISPLANTTYTVIGSNFNCTNTGTIAIGINPIPTLTITSATNTICSGSSQTLLASGAANYSWNPGTSNTATINASPLITTVYSVTGSYSTGCMSELTTTLFVVSQPTLIISNIPASLCSGESATLIASGANSYTWNPGSYIGNNFIVSPSVTTLYTLVGSNGNCQNTASLSIVINNFSIAASSSNSTICAGETATLYATGANTYSWSTGNQSNTIFVTPNVSTSYTVVGFDTNNCEKTTTILQEVSECLGYSKNEILISEMQIFPNPNNGGFIVKLNSNPENKTIEIYNSLGELVLIQQLHDFETSLDIKNKANGVYLIFLKESNRSIGQLKLIKE